MKIQDSVAFVTGAHRGLGLAFTKELLGRGVKTVYAGMCRCEEGQRGQERAPGRPGNEERS